VVFAASTGVAASVSAVVVDSVGVACSVAVVWVGSVCVVDSPFGACPGDLRALVELAECVPRAVTCSRAREALPFVPVPFVAALAVLPGKACAASSVKTPVSVAEPASSQRLQRARRRREASRERLDGGVVMGTYSTPLPSSH